MAKMIYEDRIAPLAAELIFKISPAMDELMSEYFNELQWPRSVGLCVLCAGGVMKSEA
jgi:hypothetical protein